MKAELIAVGTELVVGQTVNTNCSYIAPQLSLIGISVCFHTVVPDDDKMLADCIAVAQSRADIIIFSGGLGPTQDDITRDVVAQVLHCLQSTDEQALAKIKQICLSKNVTMSHNVARQALILEGSFCLPNEVGLAVGSTFIKDKKTYALLPGPPKEFMRMFERHLKPWLLENVVNKAAPIQSKTIKFAAISESVLDDHLTHLMHEYDHITFAPCVQDGEVTVRISTKNPSKRLANIQLDDAVFKIKQQFQEHVYATEDVCIESVVVRLLQHKNVTVSVAESCTGGLLMHLLSSIPGSSSIFKGGIVCYSNEIKHQLLHVPLHHFEGQRSTGAVSADVAKLLAENIRIVCNSCVGLSITGIAGPSCIENKPLGLVYVAIAQKQKRTEVHELRLYGDRDTISRKATKQVLYYLWKMITNS